MTSSLCQNVVILPTCRYFGLKGRNFRGQKLSRFLVNFAKVYALENSKSSICESFSPKIIDILFEYDFFNRFFDLFYVKMKNNLKNFDKNFRVF